MSRRKISRSNGTSHLAMKDALNKDQGIDRGRHQPERPSDRESL
jgi:hypothetical protein